jgi:hypothetical protein
MYPRVITHKKEYGTRDQNTNSNNASSDLLGVDAYQQRSDRQIEHVHLVRAVVCMAGYVISCVTGTRMQ